MVLLKMRCDCGLVILRSYSQWSLHLKHCHTAWSQVKRGLQWDVVLFEGVVSDI